MHYFSILNLFTNLYQGGAADAAGGGCGVLDHGRRHYRRRVLGLLLS